MSVVIVTYAHTLSGLYTAGRLLSDTVQVVQISHMETTQFDVKNTAETLISHIKDLPFSHILLPDGGFLTAVGAYMSAQLYIPMLSNVVGVGKKEFTCKQYGGAILTTVTCDAPQVCMGVDTESFKPYTGHIKVKLHISIPDTHNILKITPVETADGLETAKKVIVIGGGVTAQKDVSTICQIAHKVGAYVGATSLIVQQGLMPSTALVGLRGVNISPDIYVGIGVSGAVYHISGIRHAKTIIAINLDADAPLCQMADFLLQADYHEVLSDLQKLLA